MVPDKYGPHPVRRTVTELEPTLLCAETRMDTEIMARHGEAADCFLGLFCFGGSRNEGDHNRLFWPLERPFAILLRIISALHSCCDRWCLA
jgi:hypothetical protein